MIIECSICAQSFWSFQKRLSCKSCLANAENQTTEPKAKFVGVKTYKWSGKKLIDKNSLAYGSIDDGQDKQ